MGVRKLFMNNNYAKIISCYAADTAGVCSALFELGGMTIVHDASGCNSTYATHDEPRWFNAESMVYISALTELDMVCGNDDKFIDDVVRSAVTLQPEFIALCNSPIPLMVGTDMRAVACSIEAQTNIPCFAVPTSGMEHYHVGAAKAWELLAERFLPEKAEKIIPQSVNILGATPLDFSINGNVESIVEFLKKSDYKVLASWAMNNTLEELSNSVNAEVNLVIANSGLPLAQYMYKKYNIPFVCGVPVGKSAANDLLEELAHVRQSKVNSYWSACRESCENAQCVIIGESVYSGTLAKALESELGVSCRIIDPLAGDKKLLTCGDKAVGQEKLIAGEFAQADLIVCDNMYLPIVPPGKKYIALPHEAFSGRCYHKARLNLIDKYIDWKSLICRK